MFGKAEWKQNGDSSYPCSCFHALVLITLKYLPLWVYVYLLDWNVLWNVLLLVCRKFDFSKLAVIKDLLGSKI